MNRTGLLGLALFTVVLSVGGCGSKDPMAPAATGGTPAGGAGGAGKGGAGSEGGAGGTTTPPDGPPPIGDYFPFKLGNSWEYSVTQPNHAPQTKIHKITKMQAVGGTGPFKDTMAYLVETQKSSGATLADATLSWQLREGTRVVRYRETSCLGGSVTLVDGSVDKCTVNEEDYWMPARVVLDEMPTAMPYAAGLAWTETYMEWIATTNYKINPPTMATVNTTQNDRWEIVAVDVASTTPAGNFTGCALIKKTSMKGAAKQYTFCKGVGKVKEEPLSTATGQTEILTRYTVM